MRLFARSIFHPSSLLFMAGVVCAAASMSASLADAPFLIENNTAMAKMMAAMDVKPTGGADKDFAAAMVPHHQGAVDMSITMLRYGHDEQLKRLAQEVIVTQQQEIAVMQVALGQPLPASAPAPTQPAPMH